MSLNLVVILVFVFSLMLIWMNNEQAKRVTAFWLKLVRLLPISAILKGVSEIDFKSKNKDKP